MPSGGQLIVAALEAQGVERVFCVPGESYLAVLDALHDSDIAVTLARHESGAAMMAEAWGKMTGRPGVAMVTRGPGATNASAGLHIAQQDSTPMILLIGQIGRDMRGRDAFQEVDYGRMFGGIAKWAAEIDSAARVPEMISRAFHTAMAGRPGPVALALPEDMLRETADVAPAHRAEPADPAPSGAATARLAEALAETRRPLVVLGGSRWTARDGARMQALAERWRLPISVTFRRQELFDNEHPNYAGDIGIGVNPPLRRRLDEADLLLVIGDRFSEIPSQGYTALGIPTPRQRLIHVHPGAEELGRVYAPWLAVNAAPGAFLEAWDGLTPPNAVAWDGEAEAAHAAYLDWSTPNVETPGRLQMAAVMATLRQTLPANAVITNGAGNFATWIHRFHRFRKFGTQLGPTSGSMGYGLPAAVAAKLRWPERPVVCFAGDGCLQMSLAELGVAAQERANIIVLVIDNGMYGTIRMHQEREYPGRVSGTALVNPDFAALSRAYGFYAESVTETAQFAPAFGRCMAEGRPSLLHLKLDPEAITPSKSLSQIRAEAEARA